MAKIEEVPEPTPKPPRTPRKGPALPVRLYLLAYNVLSALGWSYVLLATVVHLLALDVRLPYFPPAALSRPLARHVEARVPAPLVLVLRRAATSYARVGAQTAFVQSFAALELLHALFGWVRSPLATTAVQVASRLYLVWGITAQFPETHENPLYASMVLSWAITEVVRYSFYALALIGAEPRVLLFLRYTLFYVLYPTGASSEALLMFSTIPKPWYVPRFGSNSALHADLRGVLFTLWWPGLYVMYTHMMKQRRKVLGPARAGGKKSGEKLKSQ